MLHLTTVSETSLDIDTSLDWASGFIFCANNAYVYNL